MGPFLEFALSALPPIASAVGNLVGQSNANKANVGLARQQMAFQERMSNTAYQRTMADTAPRASIPCSPTPGQGGATTPGGASATMQDAIGPAVSGAMDAIRLRKDMELITRQGASSTSRNRARAEAKSAWSQAWVDADEHLDPETGKRIPNPTSLRARTQAQLDSTRAATALTASQAALNSAGLPAARIEGSKAYAITNLILRSLTGLGAGAIIGKTLAPPTRPYRRN